MWKLTICGCGCEQNRRGGQNEVTVFRERFLCERERAEEKVLVRYYSLSKRFQDHFAFASRPHRLDSLSVHFFYTNYRSRSELSVHSSNSVYKTSMVPSPFHSGFVNSCPQCPGIVKLVSVYLFSHLVSRLINFWQFRIIVWPGV